MALAWFQAGSDESLESELPNPAYRIFVLIMLVIAGIFSSVDRQLIAILLEPIKAEFGASDIQMGLLAGFYFSAFHAIMLIPLAALSDRGNRRTIIASCVAVWSVATMLCGAAQTYTQLALSRMLVAVGEAGNLPASYSILSQIFPARQRAVVLGIVISGGSIGIGLGIMFGGLLNEVLGWRLVFIALGLPGLLFALALYLTVREPKREVADRTVLRPRLWIKLREFWRLPAYRLLIFLSFIGGCAGYSAFSWMPTFFVRVHGMTLGQVGLNIGLAMAVGLALGNIVGGYLADRFAKGNPQYLIYISAVGLMMCVPSALLMTLHPNHGFATVGFTGFMFFLAFYPPCNAAAAVGLVDVDSRATMSATLMLFIALGGVAGPVIIGFLNEFVNASRGALALQSSMLIVIVYCAIGSIAAASFAHFAKGYSGEPQEEEVRVS